MAVVNRAGVEGTAAFCERWLLQQCNREAALSREGFYLIWVLLPCSGQ